MKVFPTVFVGATLVFVGVAIYNVDFWAALIFSAPLIVFLFNNPGRYLKLKEVFLDYDAQTISVSMGHAKWKEYKFDQLQEVLSGKMDGILELYFVNGDKISFLAGRLWGKEKEVEKVKTELNDIKEKYSRK